MVSRDREATRVGRRSSGSRRGVAARSWLSAALCGGLYAGCSTATDAPTPPSFSRPAKVAFACLEIAPPVDGKSAAEARPLGACREGASDEGSGGDLVLHAVVTQSQTGEVALVDLEAKRVLDSRDDVPGYTFVDVGELPVAIVVPEEAAEFTYIASEDGELGVFRTVALRPADRAIRARAQNDIVRLPAPARPTAMVIAPDESALFVVARNTGQLFRVPICRESACGDQGLLGEPEAITLPAVADTAITPGPEAEPYTTAIACSDSEPGFVLPAEPQWPASVLAVAGDADAGLMDVGVGDFLDTDAGVDATGDEGGAAQPVALAVDTACDGEGSCAPRLLIADVAQPVIHRYQIDASGLTALPPWVAGAPTNALVATPDVPVSIGGEEQTHYVYAIDDSDGSVLVLQDGRVLPVNADPLSRVDRLALGITALGTRAEVIEVINTTSSDDATSCEVSEDGYGSPERLRGVFLVVGTSAGELRFYDIHDYDLLSSTPAGSGGTCRRCPWVVQRHRPRAGSDLGGVSRSYPLGSLVSTTPSYAVGDRELAVQADGSTRDPRTPELACIPCPDGMQQAFTSPANDEAASDDALCGEVGDVSQGRICAPTDPFALSTDVWTLIFEGVIPNALGVASFEGDTSVTVLEGATDLCALGVQGADTIAAGDLFEITTPPPAFDPAALPSGIRAQCQSLTDALQAGERAAQFEILEARSDQVRLSTQNLVNRVLDATLQARVPRDLATVRGCFNGQPVAFQIRAQDSFLVQGSAAGFLHRVISDEDGRCIEDSEQSPLRSSRAAVAASAADGFFSNGRVAFSLVEQNEALPVDLAVSLSFSVGKLAAPLISLPASLDSGLSQNALLSDLQYNPVDDRIYVVDPYTQQLVGLSMKAESPSRFQ